MENHRSSDPVFRLPSVTPPLTLPPTRRSSRGIPRVSVGVIGTRAPVAPTTDAADEAPIALLVQTHGGCLDGAEVHLANAGFDVIRTQSIAETLGLASLADVAFVDLLLPDGSGVEVVARLAHGPGRAQVAIVSGSTSSDLGGAAMRAGAAAHLHPPFADEELIRLALRLLESAKTEREREALLRQVTLNERLALIGRTAAALAHDIASPLAAALLNSDALNEMLFGAAPEVREAARDLRVALDHAVEILHSARRDKPTRTRAAPERTVVRRAIDRALTVVPRSLLDGVAVTVDVSTDLVAREIDEADLSRIVANLVANAAHALEHARDRRLALRAARRSGWIELKVADTGCGIAPEHLESVFEPFMTTREARGGTGLGLALAADRIREAGGRIDVESEPGEGTEFRILLRASESPPA